MRTRPSPALTVDGTVTDSLPPLPIGVGLRDEGDPGARQRRDVRRVGHAAGQVLRVGDRQLDLVVADRGVGVLGLTPVPVVAVTEVPGVRGDRRARGRGGGGVEEARRVRAGDGEARRRRDRRGAPGETNTALPAQLPVADVSTLLGPAYGGAVPRRPCAARRRTWSRTRGSRSRRTCRWRWRSRPIRWPASTVFLTRADDAAGHLVGHRGGRGVRRERPAEQVAVARRACSRSIRLA